MGRPRKIDVYEGVRGGASEVLARAGAQHGQRLRDLAAVLRAEDRVGMGGQRTVPVEEWLEDEYFAGPLVESLWPANKRFVAEASRSKYKKVIYRGSIGCGKTTACNSVVVRKIYEFLCDPNFKKKVGVLPSAKVSILYLSVTKEKAKETGFEELRSLISEIPFFQEEENAPDPKYKDSLRFRGNLRVLPVVASRQGVISWNAIMAFLDESSFGKVVDQSKLTRGKTRVYDQMAETCEELERRIDSRFMTKNAYYGKILLGSSAQYPDDFTEREALKAEKTGESGKSVYVCSHPLWVAKRGVLDRTTGEPVYSDESTPEGGFTVELGDERTLARILPDGEPPRLVEDEHGELHPAKTIRVPVEFRKRFEDDIEGALRDLAGIAVLTRTSYIGDGKALARAIREKGTECGAACLCDQCAAATHPFTSLEPSFAAGEALVPELLARQDPETKLWQPRVRPDAWRFVHIDPAIDGPAGFGDALGIAMCHVAGGGSVVRTLPDGEREVAAALDVYTDFALRVVRDPNEPHIRWDPLLELLTTLRGLGFLIAEVTMDSFQSAYFLERLQLNGFSAEKLSVDMSLEPYGTLRSAIVERRWSTYHYPIAFAELAELEYDAKKRKVDHPKRGSQRNRKPSKDVADAIAGSAYRAVTRYLEHSAAGDSAAVAVVGAGDASGGGGASAGYGRGGPLSGHLPIAPPPGMIGGGFGAPGTGPFGSLASALRPGSSMPAGIVPGQGEMTWRPLLPSRS